jgi:RNA polymerase sigma factor (sigma-70 family)
MAKNRDHDRLTEWFRRFKSWRIPLRKFPGMQGAVGAQDLDDVAQEVFLRLLRYKNTELIEYPQAYLLRMAANVVGEWALLARHRHPHEEGWLAGLPAATDYQPDQQADRETARRDFRAALEHLPPRQREVLRLHFGEGLTRPAIAMRLKISARMVKRDLVQAYAALRTDRNAAIAEVLSDETGGSHESP